MKQVLCILLFSYINTTAQSDTIKVYFEIGEFETNQDELQMLDVDKSNWDKVDIISYADYLGSDVKNEKLSLNRSLEIRSRLVQKGLNTEVLGIVEGRGAIGAVLDNNSGIQENRRSDIIVYTETPSRDSETQTEELTHHTIVEPIEEVVELKTKLESSKVGDHLVLNEMIFLPGQHFLNEASGESYAELLDLMKENPNLKIQIEGHICCKIDHEDGLDLVTNIYNLSEARAQYIYNNLINDRVSADRLTYEGFARRKPLYPLEQTEEEKQLNRRVEILIIEK